MRSNQCAKSVFDAQNVGDGELERIAESVQSASFYPSFNRIFSYNELI